MLDWQAIIGPDLPLLETIFRGTVMYFALLLLMRLNKREAGELGLADLLVIVIIADASQNALGGEYYSLTNGILLVAVIIFWDYAIDRATYHLPILEKLKPKTICLIKDGNVQKAGLRHEMITRKELMEQLRIQGVDDPKRVKRAFIESSGKISVIKYED